MDKSKRVVSWYSYGAASTVATKLMLNIRPDAVIVCQHIESEHPDNARYLKDCEEWFGKKVIIQTHPEFKTHWDVIKKRRYISGVAGAPCTGELKRKLAESFVDHFNDIEVFGYTAEEQGRVDLFKKNNPERMIYPILIEKGLVKQDCLALIKNAGIELPEMYKLGYKNNNCIGCVKGQMGYWNKIRVDFPDVFERMSRIELELKATINKKYEIITITEAELYIPLSFWGELKQKGKVIFNGESYKITKNNKVQVRRKVYLASMDPKAGSYESEASLDCGILCGIVDSEIN